jgi:hypothetical protein
MHKGMSYRLFQRSIQKEFSLGNSIRAKHLSTEMEEIGEEVGEEIGEEVGEEIGEGDW